MAVPLPPGRDTAPPSQPSSMPPPVPQVPPRQGNLPQVKPTTPMGSPAEFMGNWSAKSIEAHRLRLPYKEALENHGIEGVRKLHEWVCTVSKRVAGPARATLKQFETLDRDRKRRIKRGVTP